MGRLYDTELHHHSERIVLIGTTFAGGQGGAADGSMGNAGVVYRLDPPISGSGPWTYTELHAFSDTSPAGHYKCHGQAGLLKAGLSFCPNHFLFEVTAEGGLFNHGTVFAQSPRQ